MKIRKLMFVLPNLFTVSSIFCARLARSMLPRASSAARLAT